MSARDGIELLLYIGMIFATAKPIGVFLEKVFEGNPPKILERVFGRMESMIYKVISVTPTEEQTWFRYARDLMGLTLVSFFVTYLILRYQNVLPLNPQKLPGLSPDLAWNTAISFATNTNWQAYGGEGTMSYFSQMVGLTLHNFFSAAAGLVAAIALIRGIASKGGGTVGNFWVDFVRANLYVFLPICVIYALFLVSQGMIQNFNPYVEATSLEGAKQVIAMGPMASQVAIKMLGTNGGGFLNANAAHPFENPTALSNFIQMLSIFLIPSGLVYFLGKKVGNTRHGWSVWAAMAILFIIGVFISAGAEYAGNPLFTKIGCNSPVNMEGKEVRFGIFDSALFASITTAASCGAVNSMHDSFTPIGGLVPLFNILMGEVVFGGVGAGLYGMALFIVLTVFISGLMVGRSPEYLGKKIEGREVKYAMFALIASCLSILAFSAWASVRPEGVASLNNPGPHGLSEMLYAFASATGNNGSAFAGLSANTPFWNVALGAAMFVGRFFMMIPILAIGGSLSQKKILPASEASFPVHGFLFTALLISVILIVGALTFLPVLSLGPIAEHFEMLSGRNF